MSRNIFLHSIVPFLLFTNLATFTEAQEWGDKMLNRRRIDFGTVARSAETTFQVTVKNPYLEEIRITSLTTSCGCISWIDQAPISIASNEERQLTIRLDTVRHVGDKHVKAMVTLSEPIKRLTSIVTISVDGRIRNDVEVRPSAVNFGTVDLGSSHSKTIRITYTGPSDWKITRVKAGSDFLVSRIGPCLRTGHTVQCDVSVDLKPEAPLGVLRDRFILTTNEAGNLEIPILIEAKVESEITITDAQFGTIAPGQPKSVTLVLRAKNPIRIDSVAHRATESTKKPASGPASTGLNRSLSQSAELGKCFIPDFRTNPGTIHMIKLTMNPPDESGMFDETFAVEIPGRVHPITFHATGRIVEQSVTSTRQ